MNRKFPNLTFLELMIQSKQSCKKSSMTESICWNLTKIFNSRQGSLQHLPDYGLCDLVNIYSNMPESINKYQVSVGAVIEKYEPRLSQVSIHLKNRDQINQILEIEIQALINNAEEVKLISCLNANGSIEVNRDMR